MPVIGCDSQGKKMVAEAGYIWNVAEQQREVTIHLDRVSITACCTHGSISFAIINHTGR